MNSAHRRLWAAGIILLLAHGTLAAGDWPQILGPARNGIAASDEKLAARWPKSGPPALWERPVGSGYAGVAVVGDHVILFHRVRDEEVTACLSAKSGEMQWSDSHPTSFTPQVGGGVGPLCVPTITDGKVVTFGAQGVLTALDLETGKRLWLRDTHQDFKAQEGYFGAGSSPIVTGGRVIVNVGGSRDGAGIVAFSMENGETLWKRTDEPASYSAPTLTGIEGIPHVVMITRYKCVMLDPATGEIRFQFPFGQRGPTVNAATPLCIQNHLLVTASYGIGSMYAGYSLLGIQKVWDGTDALASQYCTPIHLDGHLYVIDGRDDVPPADLKCIELATGKTNWVEHNFGYGTLILADGKLVAVKTDGEIVLLSPNPVGLQTISRSKVFRGTVRALPAISNGRLYLRDESTLKCLDLTAGL